MLRPLLLAWALVLLGCGLVEPPAHGPGPSGGDFGRPGVRPDPLRGGSTTTVFFSQVWESVSANRANPANIAEHCAAAIDAASRSLDVCVYEIDNRVITEALVQAARRGVAVRVVTEQDYAGEAGPRAFRAAGIPHRTDARDALMHNKFMVIDGRAVWTGSFNFSENDAYQNNNNAVLIVDERVAAAFAEKFSWFWDHGKFGGRPARTAKIPYAVADLADGTTVEIYFSTHDKVDQKVIGLVQRARRSIKFLVFSFTHDQIARAMIDAANRGVRVTGVFETRQLSKFSEMERLSGHGNIHVFPDGNRYNMHHKLLIVDDQIVATGSFNFSASAANDNDENLVILHSAVLARQFDEEFQRVLRAAQSTIATGAAATWLR